MPILEGGEVVKGSHVERRIERRVSLRFAFGSLGGSTGPKNGEWAKYLTATY